MWGKIKHKKEGYSKDATKSENKKGNFLGTPQHKKKTQQLTRTKRSKHRKRKQKRKQQNKGKTQKRTQTKNKTKKNRGQRAATACGASAAQLEERGDGGPRFSDEGCVGLNIPEGGQGRHHARHGHMHHFVGDGSGRDEVPEF